MRGEYDLAAVWHLRNLIRREHVRICHAHTSHAHSLLWLATLGMRNVNLVVSRRVDFAVAKNILSRRKYLSARVHFVAISNGVKSILRNAGVPEQNVSIVPSGIDVNKFHMASESHADSIRSEFHIPPSSQIVGNIAHLADHKGHRYLLDAADIVIKEKPDVVFLIVGEGEERSALEKQISRLGLQSKIILAGFRENVAPFLRAFDVFALSSYLEGLCTSLLDAMLLGVPVVATRTGGVPDIVKHDDNGLLVEPKNPSSLAEAILRLLRDRELAERLSRRGKETVLQNFTAEKMVEGTINVYNSLLESCKKAI
jgi:glycosyltransferase involved in cell wall biosynthesis